MYSSERAFAKFECYWPNTEIGDTAHFQKSLKESFVWLEGHVCSKISSMSDSLRSAFDFQ